MPTLASVTIPVSSPSSPSDRSSTGTLEETARAPPQRRLYSEGLLPVGPSDHGPRGAHILARQQHHTGAFYVVNIAGVMLKAIGIDKILDYVSSEHLEEFENRQFVAEAEDEAKMKRQKLERQQHRRERARSKGTVVLQEVDDAERSVSDSADGAKRRGRARPTYTQFYKVPAERRRRKRDPQTGELMPLSDAGESESSSEGPDPRDEAPSTHVSSSGASQAEQLQRRRRERDPVTSELLPLKPSDRTAAHWNPSNAKKRPRRRRHPLTGKLMPLGWRFRPDASTGQLSRVTNDVPPGMRRLSISERDSAKRVKLSQSPARSLQQTSAEGTPESEESSAKPKRPGETPRHGSLKIDTGLFATTTTVGKGSSNTKPYKQSRLTSFTQPTAKDLAAHDESQEEQDELDEGEYMVEDILAHRVSDPKTHPPKFGNKPVTLYQVKWEGWSKPSWEPIESFRDRSVVADYHKQLVEGTQERPPDLLNGGSTADTASSSRDKHTAKQQLQVATPAQRSESEEDEDSDDGSTFDIDEIVGHKLSDPKTHGLDYQKAPIMLYKVKWKGFEDHTWEPISSFVDPNIVNEYRRSKHMAILRV